MNHNKEFCTKQGNDIQVDNICTCGWCSSVYQENNNDTIIDIKARKYEIHKIYNGGKYNKSHIHSSIISKNEQYLVYNLNDRLQIYNLKMMKTQKSIYQQNHAVSIQFTIDSKFLFVGDQQGFVCGYLVQHGFVIFYKQKVHLDNITQIIILKQYLITASHDKKIIKTNFTNRELIFRLVGHSYHTSSIEYDIEKDILISTSHDKSTRIWDCANQRTLIQYKHQYVFKQIYLIDNKQDLLCSNFQCNLWIFKIDYQNKKLVKQYVYQDQNDILSFQQVNSDKILLICAQYCKILDYQGKLIHKIEHTIDLNYAFYIPYRQQLENINYIILQDMQKIYLLQAQKQK